MMAWVLLFSLMLTNANGERVQVGVGSIYLINRDLCDAAAVTMKGLGSKDADCHPIGVAGGEQPKKGARP